MKKRLIIASIIILICIFSTIVLANNINQLTATVVQFKIFVNGEEKDFYNPIVVINDRTYIPLRETGETLGMDVKWFEENQTIIIQNLQKNDDTESLLYTFGVDEGTRNSKVGYKDAFDNIIIEPIFERASKFKEGLARVSMNRGYGQDGYINVKGDFIIPPQYYCAYDFSNGAALIDKGGAFIDRYYYIDKSGNVLFDGKEFIEADSFSEGYAVVLTKGYGKNNINVHPDRLKDSRYSYINTQGELATELEFEEAEPFKSGLAAVKNNGKWGAINKNFELVIDYLYDDYNFLTK